MYQEYNTNSHNSNQYQNVVPSSYQNERASAPRALFFFIGTILLIIGITLLIYNYEKPKIFLSENKEDIYIKLREGEGFLRQNTKESAKLALQIFNNVLANNVNLDLNQKAKYGIAAALEILEENSSALSYYHELKNQNIKDAKLKDKVNFSLGRFYLYLNHESEGRALLEPLLANTHNRTLRSKVLTAFGGYYLRRREFKRAEENFRVALKYDGENIKAEEGRAQAIKEQGHDWSAYKLYDDYFFSTAHLNPDNRQKVINKIEYETFNSGIKAFRVKKYQNAIDFFRKVSNNTNDKNIEEDSRFWIGESFYKLKENKKAIKAYENVLKNINTSKDAAALFKIGMILFGESKLSAAGKVFNEIITNYPDSKYSDKAKDYINDIHKENEERFSTDDSSNYVLPKVNKKENLISNPFNLTEEPKTYEVPSAPSENSNEIQNKVEKDDFPKYNNQDKNFDNNENTENYNQEYKSENFDRNKNSDEDSNLDKENSNSDIYQDN